MKKINKLITEINRWKGRYGASVQWIVIHYTAGDGDTAVGNCRYFAEGYRAASAHFFVDETSIWQSVELADTAWHCGDIAVPKNGCTNLNSIGIEMCSDKDPAGEYYISDETVDNTVDLVLYLLTLYPNAKLCRHYDVTGKWCPMPWVKNEQLWIDFQERVKGGLPLTTAERKEFDTLKSSLETLKKKVSAMESNEKANFSSMEKTIQDTYNTIQKSVKDINNEVMPRWDKVDGNMPKWMKATMKKLVDKGYLKGDAKGNLQVSYQLARILVVLDRTGAFDK